MEARKNRLCKYATNLSDDRLIQAFNDIYEFREKGILRDGTTLREIGREICDILSAPTEYDLRYAEDAVMEELSRRYVSIIEKSKRPLQRGDDIYYVNFAEGMVEHGTIVYPVYKHGELDSFSVDFDNGDFDEFIGSAFGKTFFTSLKTAESVFSMGESQE